MTLVAITGIEDSLCPGVREGVTTYQSWALATLTLTTDPTSRPPLDRKPDTSGKRLFTADVVKMILG